MGRTMIAFLAVAASIAFAQPDRLANDRESPRKTETGSTAGANPSLTVSKTAFPSGPDVCGAISITNTGTGTVKVAGIADQLEVHFSNNVPPSGLTAGSTPNWFKVADVPIALPAPIAPRKTATINYCFPLCQAADYPGANSMRNAVTVTVANKSFGARSNSFTPPFPDCRACCLPDGSCTNTISDRCTSAGGVPKGSGTNCANTRCTQACCFGEGSCRDETLENCRLDEGDALGPGTTCATTECPRGCCYSDGGCEDLPPTECVTSGGRPHDTPGSSCADTLGCPLACCRSDGTCDDVAPPFCLPPNSIRLGPGTQCATSECPRPCCLDDGTCTEMGPDSCFAAGGQSLDPDQARDCAEVATYGGCPRACCVQGQCNEFFPLECSIRQGELQGPGSFCTLDQCPRACCHNDGSCSEETFSACQAAGGQPQSVHDSHGQHIGIDCEILDTNFGGCSLPCCGFGPGSNFCNTIPPDQCRSFGGYPQAVTDSCGISGVCDGACCFGGSCEVMHWSECEAQGGDPQAPGTDCGFGPLSPCSVNSP